MNHTESYFLFAKLCLCAQLIVIFVTHPAQTEQKIPSVLDFTSWMLVLNGNGHEGPKKHLKTGTKHH